MRVCIILLTELSLNPDKATNIYMIDPDSIFAENDIIGVFDPTSKKCLDSYKWSDSHADINRVLICSDDGSMTTTNGLIFQVWRQITGIIEPLQVVSARQIINLKVQRLKK